MRQNSEVEGLTRHQNKKELGGTLFKLRVTENPGRGGGRKAGVDDGSTQKGGELGRWGKK